MKEIGLDQIELQNCGPFLFYMRGKKTFNQNFKRVFGK